MTHQLSSFKNYGDNRSVFLAVLSMLKSIILVFLFLICKEAIGYQVFIPTTASFNVPVIPLLINDKDSAVCGDAQLFVRM